MAKELTWIEFRLKGLKDGKTMPEISADWKAFKVEPRLTPATSATSEAAQAGVSNGPEDYLRKYQVRKQTKDGSPESDPSKGSKAERQKESWLASPKVTMIFPRKDGEDKSHTQTVNVNGYHLEFPKQQYIDVPKPVADTLYDSLNQTEKALQQNRIDGSKDRENALL